MTFSDETKEEGESNSAEKSAAEETDSVEHTEVQEQDGQENKEDMQICLDKLRHRRNKVSKLKGNIQKE